ncbi:HRDC domain-containing protein [Clostridium sp. AL.422]|uniref:HRDC domain-containing protein n=1 Tax=Clostridium TaxID=1485 RepID=UPI00293DE5AD|nr:MULTISPECIES: HRDC domain-containing protein [unclassified Clostridium]MDV4150281.1 HRDC domain-containing protein [Clostridium sp. AL.422]
MSYVNKYKSLLDELNTYTSTKKTEEISRDVSIISSSNKANINEEIINSLKDFRLKKSKEEGNKPYFIFNDKQMMDLIDKMPKNNSELKEVSGFGGIKVEKYGEDLIKIISKYK